MSKLKEELKDAAKKAGREAGEELAAEASKGLFDLLRRWLRGERPLREWRRRRRDGK